METGLYLFCFGRAGALAAWRPPEGVFTARAGPASAVLAEVDLEEFRGPEAERRLQDLAWLAPRACRHEQVVEEAMRHSPVLPARFGTIFSTLARLEQLAGQRGALIEQFLERAAGCEEWGLQATLEASEFREAVREETGRRAGQSLSPGARYLKERGLRSAAERDLRAVMTGFCRELAAHPAAPWRDRPSTGCLCNFSLLLPCAQVAAFREAVARARQRAPRGLLLRATGPWPPYSFAPELGEP